MMQHRYPNRPFTLDVDYRDVFAELTFRPDPDEPTLAEYGR